MTFKLLAQLEWKAAIRKGNMAQTILMGIGKGYFGICYLLFMVSMCFGMFIIAEEQGIEPLQGFFKYAIYLWLGDLIIRYFFQKMPTTLIKPLLIQNIKKGTIVRYCMTKVSLSFFNFVNVLMAITLALKLIRMELVFTQSLMFAGSFFILLLANCYLVQLLNHIRNFAIPFLVVCAAIMMLDFYKYIEVTSYTKFFFEFVFNQPLLIILLTVYLLLLIKSCFDFYKNNLSLDSVVVVKKDTYKTYDLCFLNRFGNLAPFLKLDLKLLTRNKRTRTVLFMSGMFLLYGLLFFTMDIYKENTFFTILAAIMITGGFMMLFGQYVPSWDSSYYPLMMTQNIPYRRYLESKWLIMAIGVALSTILASFYIIFGLKIYLVIVAVGCYNIGWNCYMSLITGAYVRSKIDLASNKNAFGDSKAFSIQTLLMSIPQLGVPMLIYVVLERFFEFYAVIIIFSLIGLLGILLKPVMFNLIERLYKKQKYITINAYK